MTAAFSLLSPDRWLTCKRPRPQAAIRLICFPYAGGGASVFRNWTDSLPESIEVCAVQLPGRESRFREPAFTRLVPLVDALAGALSSRLDRPFAFFGHSLGALVAFELARRLERHGGPRPVHLFASACRAPQLPADRPSVHTLPDAEFRGELRSLNGTPEPVLNNDELMNLLVHTLRADFAVYETYAFRAGPPLTCPITALGGWGDDTVSVPELEAWSEQTLDHFRLRLLPGDHFFLRASRTTLLQILAHELLQTLRRAAFSPCRTRKEASIRATVACSPKESGADWGE